MRQLAKRFVTALDVNKSYAAGAYTMPTIATRGSQLDMSWTTCDAEGPNVVILRPVMRTPVPASPRERSAEAVARSAAWYVDIATVVPAKCCY